MTINFFWREIKGSTKIERINTIRLIKKLSVSKGTISAYEQGLSYPSIEKLVKNL